MSESTVLGSVLGWLSLYSLPPDRARKVSLPTEPFISASCADGKTTRFALCHSLKSLLIVTVTLTRKHPGITPLIGRDLGVHWGEIVQHNASDSVE